MSVMSLRMCCSALGPKHERQRRWMQQTFVVRNGTMCPSVLVYVGAFVVNTMTLLPLDLIQSREKVRVELQNSCCQTF